jgi:hypothetical protein
MTPFRRLNLRAGPLNGSPNEATMQPTYQVPWEKLESTCATLKNEVVGEGEFSTATSNFISLRLAVSIQLFSNGIERKEFTPTPRRRTSPG